MFRGHPLKTASVFCILDLVLGFLMADATVSNFRGEVVRKAIKDLQVS